MFGLGLAWSGGNVPQEGLVPVPTQLFQGSLLLGTVAKVFLGDNLGQSSSVLIHPLLIGGWCGLVSTALNLLPVGAIDGGKMVQAAYGRSALGITSFFTYVGLGLGFLGSSLALPFGLYVLICQRNPERHIQDQVTQATAYRQTLTTVAVILSILILLPAVPGLQDTGATGGGGISL
jgi:membrane-associated protease RseP (regulator of RpoE activity)